VHIRAGITWDAVKWAASTYYASNWHPLTWLSHATDISLFNLNAAGHHSASLLLHVVLLLWDYWPLGRWNPQVPAESALAHQVKSPSWRALVTEKVPLFVVAGISGLLTMKAQSAGGAVQITNAIAQGVAAFPITVRLQNAVVANGQYLRDAIWPSGLAAMYPHPGRSISLTSVILAAVITSAITAVALWSWRKRGYLIVGWLWFLGTLIPMIGLIQVGSQARADRYAYLPLIGLFLIAGCGLAEICSKWPGTRAAVATATVVALLGLGARTFRQVGYWQNPETLWTRALQVTKGNFFAHDSLGGYYIQLGRMENARKHFEASLRIFPNDMLAQEGLAVCYQAAGETDEAIEQYQNVLRLSIDSAVRATAFANLGSIYRTQGKYAQAKKNYDSGPASES
jgi:hypothetical protein